MNARVTTAREQDEVHKTGFLRVDPNDPPTTSAQQYVNDPCPSGPGEVRDSAGSAYPTLADASKASRQKGNKMRGKMGRLSKNASRLPLKK